METLKNAFRGIFQLASARYTPAPASVNQALRARFTPAHPAPDGKRRINQRFLKANAEVSVSRSAGTRCQDLSAADLVSHRKTALGKL
jgi:hypothetical protein